MQRLPLLKRRSPRLRRLALAGAVGLTVTCIGAIHPALGDATAGALDVTRQLPRDRTGPSLPAYFQAVDRAEADVQAGRYRLALLEIRGEQGSRASDIRIAALLALGNVDAAANAAETPAQLALVAEAQGDLAEARRQLEAALEQNPGDLQTRRNLGRLAETAGDTEAALAAYAWFADEGFLQRWQRDPDSAAFERAEDVVTIAAALDRYATLTEGYRDDPNLHDVILSMYVRAYDVIDRGNTDAQLAAARFAYDKSDRKEAADVLTAVLTRNPGNVAALQLLGRLSLDGYNFEKVQQVVGALRAINPASRPADLLEARSMLLQRQAALAEPMLRRVLNTDPDNLEALGLLAAIHAVRLDQPAVERLLAQVETIDPDNASAYLAIGEQLASLRQYERAVDMLSIAIERAPYLTAARNELGATLTQAGREAAAVAALELAVAYDPFNAASLNYLKLLEDMAGYDRIDTEHFAVRWDPEHDPADAVTAEMWAEWLDQMHEDVAELYQWSPDQPTEIQMFPTHDRFSVRVAGDPYIGTVGACTGPVIAMVVPKDGDEALGPYDWARVLRHEYVHTITLGATDNRIWHWLTEGIAVREEHAPVIGGGDPVAPRPTYLTLLTRATLEGTLFPVDQLTWGFVRPRKPTDRSQAYAQSWYAVEYIVERWGEQALLDLLVACREGKTEAEGFAEVLDITLGEFDRDFEQRMRQHLREWGRDPVSTVRYQSLMQEGQSALRARDFEAAIASFEEARQVRPEDQLPIQRLAGLYLARQVDRPLDAAEMLMELHERTQGDNRFAKRAARIYLEQNDPAEALASATAAVYMGPYDIAAHELLRDAAEFAGDDALAAKQAERLERLQSQD